MYICMSMSVLQILMYNALVKKINGNALHIQYLYSNRGRTTKQGLFFGFVFRHHKVKYWNSQRVDGEKREVLNGL
jgi:hypothetical protein